MTCNFLEELWAWNPKSDYFNMNLIYLNSGLSTSFFIIIPDASKESGKNNKLLGLQRQNFCRQIYMMIKVLKYYYHN